MSSRPFEYERDEARALERESPWPQGPDPGEYEDHEESGDWSRCIRCGSTDIVGKSVDVTADGANQPCYCNNCDAEWVEFYKQDYRREWIGL